MSARARSRTRRLGVGLGLGVGALVVLAAIVLGLAHRQIGALAPALPDPPGDAGELPVRIAWINTATQPMSRAGILEPSLDPRPDAPYVMSHPAFVLQWADGRLFVVDAGMDAATASGFGRVVTLVGDAEPIRPLTDLGTALGPAVERVRGLAFTHLHQDHVDGASTLCGHPDRPDLVVPWYRLGAQATRHNHTTGLWGRRLEDLPCLAPHTLAGEGFVPVPGFPGLSIAHAAGHTPGSQLLRARVDDGGRIRTHLLVGDLANAVDGILHDVPKPRLYSLLVVPESTRQLSALRRRLRERAGDPDTTLLVAHDQLHLESTGIPPWRAPGRAP